MTCGTLPEEELEARALILAGLGEAATNEAAKAMDPAIVEDFMMAESLLCFGMLSKSLEVVNTKKWCVGGNNEVTRGCLKRVDEKHKNYKRRIAEDRGTRAQRVGRQRAIRRRRGISICKMLVK